MDDVVITDGGPPEPVPRAREAARARERQRVQTLHAKERYMTADELRLVLKQERHRTGRMAADLAACRAEAESIEEGHALLRKMDRLKEEKGRILLELELEEEQ